jgi:hypothetical protein
LDPEGNLVLDRSLIDGYAADMGLLRRTFQWIKQRSYLASLVSERRYLARRKARERRAVEQLDRSGTEVRIGDEYIYHPQLDETWRNAVEITEGILTLFKEKVQGAGAEFVLVSIAGAEAVHPELQPPLNEQFGVQFDYDQPHRIIDQWATRTATFHLGLTPVFRQYHRDTGEYLHGFTAIEGHWNEAGHALAASSLLTFLLENDLVPRTLASERKSGS